MSLRKKAAQTLKDLISAKLKKSLGQYIDAPNVGAPAVQGSIETTEQMVERTVTLRDLWWEGPNLHTIDKAGTHYVYLNACIKDMRVVCDESNNPWAYKYVSDAAYREFYKINVKCDV